MAVGVARDKGWKDEVVGREGEHWQITDRGGYVGFQARWREDGVNMYCVGRWTSGEAMGRRDGQG